VTQQILDSALFVDFDLTVFRPAGFKSPNRTDFEDSDSPCRTEVRVRRFSLERR
jgi:hypothetical protein